MSRFNGPRSAAVLLICPIFALSHHPPHSPNVSLRRTHHLAPLLWLCRFGCNLPVMQRQFVGLGMRPQHLSFDLLSATDGDVCPRHITLSLKVLVKSLHTCNPRVGKEVGVRHACTSTAFSPLAGYALWPLEWQWVYVGPTDKNKPDLCLCNTV